MVHFFGAKVIYSQMPRGFGKSWVDLLVCMYLKEIENKTAVYVAINQGLLNQIKSKIR